MNPNYQEFKFPQIRAKPFGSMFNESIPPEAIDLTSTLLFYVPTRRCKAIEVKRILKKSYKLKSHINWAFLFAGLRTCVLRRASFAQHDIA